MIRLTIDNSDELLQLIIAKDFFADKLNIHQLALNGNEVDFDAFMNDVKLLGFKSNLYAIYTKEKNSTSWNLNYIGQSKSNLFRSRLRAHVHTRHDDTGAQLQNVFDALKDGKDIGVKFMRVEPEELRHYYEENLINHFYDQLNWNKQKGKKRKK